MLQNLASMWGLKVLQRTFLSSRKADYYIRSRDSRILFHSPVCPAPTPTAPLLACEERGRAVREETQAPLLSWKIR